MNKKTERKRSNKAVWDDRTQKQMMIYLAICPERDYQVLTMKEDMLLSDFERIIYSLDLLDFTEYAYCLQEEYEDFFYEYARNLENEVSSDDSPLPEKYENWLIAFCEQLPTERMRECFKEML